MSYPAHQYELPRGRITAAQLRSYGRDVERALQEFKQPSFNDLRLIIDMMEKAAWTIEDLQLHCKKGGIPCS